MKLIKPSKAVRENLTKKNTAKLGQKHRLDRMK